MGKWFMKIKGQLGRKLALADKLTMCLAALLVAGSLVTVMPAFAAGEVDSNLGGTDVSISRFSEVIAESFNNVLSNAFMKKGQAKRWMEKVDAGAGSGPAMYADVGRIGNLLGYAGGNDTAENSSNVWTKGTDAASRVLTLQTVAGFYTDDTENVQISNKSAMSHYIVWGSALNYLGIDEFRDAQSAADGMRTIIGYAMYVCFILAYTAGGIMSKVVSLMHDFNVFNMFYKGGTNFLLDIAGGDSEFIDTINSALDVMYKLRWVIMGFLVIAFAATVTFWKSKGYNQAVNAQQKFRNMLYRIIVMAIGIPLCGMVYTECIDIVDAQVNASSTTLTDYVFQEFLDFEKWTTGSVDRTTGKSTSFYVDPATGLSEIHVVYETDMQQFSITGGGSQAGAIDASKFVFAANQSMYTAPGADGSDASYIGTVDNANFVQKLFGRPGDDVNALTGSYSDLQRSGNNITGANKSKAYNAARNLILNYARSNTVSPDTLNDVYILDYNEMVAAMTDDPVVNSTAIEQMFGVNAAQQRIWSYIGGMGAEWIYENDGTSLEILLAGGAGAEIKATLKGVTAFPYTNTAGSGVTINSTSGSETRGATIMRRCLTNGVGGANVMKVKDPVITGVDNKNYKYDITYDLSTGGMSALSLYNYMHTKFENGQITVYSPDNTTNAGVGLMHYAVTTPYSGIPEIVQLLYVLAVLFSLGVIGWVFGISLLISTIIQSLKAIPIIFKMLMGSAQGFVEGLLIAFSIAIELLVTMFLYTQAVNIIDFLIKLVGQVARIILSAFNNTTMSSDNESYAILSGAISIFIIMWGTFELIKWRQAITISIKSLITHLCNTVFGTSAAMPTGASNGMLKGAAALAAGGMAMGALANDGALDDVVNDLTGTDLGSSVHDKLSEGDWEGAMQDIQDYAGGTYRGSSDTADAEAALGEGGDIGSANGWQSLTDDDKAELAEKYGDDLQDAEDDVAAAQAALADGTGSQEDLDEATAKRDALRQEMTADAAGRRHANYEKANELGVADYGDYLREQKAEAEANGLQPVEGADIPDEPSKTLDRDGQMAYDAARDGDAQTLRTASQTYDGNGLTAAQRAKVNEMIANGADETEIAAAIDNMKQDNFGDDADAVVDKINEAAGRDGVETYGSADNSDGNARTVTVSGSKDGTTGGIEYAVTDNNSDAGEQRIKVSEADGQSIYENITDGSDAKGDQIATVDMGTQEASDAMAMDYADIRNNMDSVANMSGGMLVKGSGSGGIGGTTVSEAAAVYSAEQSKVIGDGTASSDYGSTAGYTAAHATQAMQAAGVADLSAAGAMQDAGGGVNVNPAGASFAGGIAGMVTGSGMAGLQASIGAQNGGMINAAAAPVSYDMSGGGNVIPAASLPTAPPAPATSGISYSTQNVDGGTVTVPMSSDGKTYVQTMGDNGKPQFVESTGSDGGTVYVKQSGSGGAERYVPLDSASTRYVEAPSSGGGTQFLPASDDGVMYVQKQGSGGPQYVRATGNEAPGTQGFVMQRDESGHPQYIETDLSARYVTSQNGGGYVPQGSRQTQTPTTVSTAEVVIGYDSPSAPPAGGGTYRPMMLGDVPSGQNAGSGQSGYQPVTLSPEQLQQFLANGTLDVDDGEMPGNVIGGDR